MEISILKSTEYYNSTGITDDTEPFNNTINRPFIQDEVLQSGTGIFQRTGEDFTAPAWDETDEPTYAENDVIFKDGILQYVSEVAGIAALQPNEYNPLPPENLSFGLWNNRYAKLGILDVNTNTWSKNTASGVAHSLRFDDTSWKYKIFKTSSYLEWSDAVYQVFVSNYTYATYSYSNTDQFIITWKGRRVYLKVQSTTPYLGQIIVDNQTEGDNTRYKIVAQMQDLTGILYWSVSKEETRYVEEEYEIPVTMLSSSTLDNYEDKAYCIDTNDCTNMWLPKTIIRIGNDLYIRSDTNDLQEEKTLTDPTYEIMEYINSISWGWTYINPTNSFSPLDGKKYTYVEAPSPVEYVVAGSSRFDTVAINGLIAETVEVTFLPYDGSDPIQTITIYPKTNRDVNNRLQPYPTTNIVYAPRDITGHVHIKFISTGSIRIGGISLGMRVDAGFTNLTFGNKFNDYSPYEKDQFGNIVYIDGVKTNVYNGTVDIPLTDYDMTNRLMASIGGNTVILNGSDTTGNEAEDGVNFFSATMVIGRIKGFTLKTKLDNKLLSQIATYSFEIEENV